MSNSGCSTMGIAGLVLTFGLTCVSPTSGETPECSDSHVVCFDHFAQNANAHYDRSFKDRDEFTVWIQNTRERCFDYKLSGVVATTDAAGGRARALTPLDNVKLEAEYDKKYGAYLVQIMPRAAPGCPPSETVNGAIKTLQGVTLVINVRRRGFELEFAGAFSGSDVTNPVYSIQEVDQEGGESQQVIVEETNKENEVRLGVAAFIHVYHTNWPRARSLGGKLAGTFGLGIQEENQAAYYLGLTYRFSDKAALTLGPIWASRNRLPGGAVVGQPPPDENTLSNLGSQIEQGWFAAVSFTFLDVKSAFGNAVKVPE